MTRLAPHHHCIHQWPERHHLTQLPPPAAGLTWAVAAPPPVTLHSGHGPHQDHFQDPGPATLLHMHRHHCLRGHCRSSHSGGGHLPPRSWHRHRAQERCTRSSRARLRPCPPDPQASLVGLRGWQVHRRRGLPAPQQPPRQPRSWHLWSPQMPQGTGNMSERAGPGPPGLGRQPHQARLGVPAPPLAPHTCRPAAAPPLLWCDFQSPTLETRSSRCGR